MPPDNASPPRDASLPPGYDVDDPYEGKDIDTYPEWWRSNIEEFREHEMRPYRPPRFVDGDLVPECRTDLEDAFDISIRFRAVCPEEGDEWELRVDDSVVATVGRQRTGQGYTEYQLTGEEFERQIRSFLDR